MLRADPSKVRVSVRRMGPRWMATVALRDGSWLMESWGDTAAAAVMSAVSWAERGGMPGLPWAS